MTSGRAIVGARCVHCQRHIDQTQLNHYPDDVPINNRWTCSPKCQQGLDKRRIKKERTEAALKEINMEDPVAALGLKSEAEKAKDALSAKPERKAPSPPPEAPELEEEEDDIAQLPGDSHPHSLLLGASKVLDGAAGLGARDMLVVAGFAQAMIDTACSLVGRSLGGPDEE